MTISINHVVPEMGFEVYQDGKFSSRSFADYQGKWLILLFYPADFTSICPTELKEAAGRYEEVKKMGGEIISFSVDTVESHKRWHESSPAVGTVAFPMGSDPDGEIAKVFGIFIKEENMSLRGTFIISPKRILKAMDVHDNSIGRSISEIIRKLQASIYISKHHGELCPASWTPGQKTLN